MIVKRGIKTIGLTARIMKMISIDTFQTPNPNFLKFVPLGHQVLGEEGTLDIPSRQYSDVSPLAQELFAIKGVTRIFYGSDYLSIAKEEKVDWNELKPQIYRIISDFYESKRQLLSGDIAFDSNEIDPNDSEVVQFIKEIIASRIRPNVQEDGGDVKFVSFDEQAGVLTIKMVGACSGCPSSTATLKGGIEKMLTYYVKEIKSVVAQQNC